MFGVSSRVGGWLAVVMAAGLLAGCGSTSLNRAPVEDRGSMTGRPMTVQMDPSTPEVKQPPGFENAGKPGYYTVKPGDTLIRIGLEVGQSSKDIARWNAVENANRIEVGQVLRVVPPVASTPAPVPVVAAAPVTQVIATPVSSSTVKPTERPAAAPAASGGEDEIAWIWPTQGGAVLAGFDDVKNKGLDIAGSAGDAVVAAADGRVVYVGAGLRGYGNLIILKHNNTYLTAYAHNQALLVKEDQAVRKGQKIAEMGNSDADRVKLHFEVRRQGKPVDPAKYLPPR